MTTKTPKIYKRFSFLLILLVWILFILGIIFPSKIAAFSGSGSGTAADPYVITNVNQLQEMNDNLTAYYVLANDIDASDTINWNGGRGFIPIAYNTHTACLFDPVGFRGSLDGQGHAICDLYIDSSIQRRTVGLFGCIKGGTVRNVGLINPNITGRRFANVGGLAGVFRNGTITNCYVRGGTIRVIGAAGPVAVEPVGGLVGQAWASISKCYSTAQVIGVGSTWIGGLIGYCNDYHDYCANCFFDRQTAGVSWSYGTGEYPAKAKTTAQMKTMSTFTGAGWDFVNIWRIEEGISYPRLWDDTACIVIDYQDIGLRVFNGTEIVAIAAEIGPATSPLRIAKNGVVYGIALIDQGSPEYGDPVYDSGVRIQTSSGIKALRRL